MSFARLPPALIALSPGTLGAGAGAAAFLPRLRATTQAGLRGLLLREPGLADADYLELARAAALELARWPGGWLGLHDRPHLAVTAGAQGVHLSARSLAARDVRAWLSDEVVLGFSSHASDDPQLWRGCDYLIHAPFAAVPHKAPALGAQGLALAVQRSGLPLWALGAVAPGHVATIREAGASGVAVLRGVFGSLDCAVAVGEYLAALQQVGLGPGS